MSKKNYGCVVFVLCLTGALAGGYLHVPMGHGMHGNSYYGNQGFHGSTLQNFYPGDWNNQRIGTYQYFDYESSPWNSNYPGNIGGSWDWSQSGSNWNQPHLNSWTSWQGNQGWNNGMQSLNGWNPNVNSNWNTGWNGNAWGSNINNGWNNGWAGNGGTGWSNGFNTGVWNGNGWNSGGWGNNWNTQFNNGWTVPDGIALQSH